MKSWPELIAVAAVIAAAPAARAQVTFFQARIAPIMERHCTVCHGAEKQKAGLRVDSPEFILKGAKLGKVIEVGNAKESEFFRRITLPKDHEDVMPSDGKPLLAADEIKNIELWIAGGASAIKVLADFPDAPALRRAPAPAVAQAPDWRPRAAEIAEFERSLGVRLVARSAVATDGLILRTASAPGRCDDATLARLAPVASLIVEAELARTKVTDAGLSALVAWENLRVLDLTRTAVTSHGLGAIARVPRLETLNLTDTVVDDAGVASLKALPTLRKVWLFGTKASAGEVTVGMVSP